MGMGATNGPQQRILLAASATRPDPVLPQGRVFAMLSGANATSGRSDPFFDLVALSGLPCIVLALANRDRPLGRSLSYWDEASWFVLIACLG